MASNIVQLRQAPDLWHMITRVAQTIEQLGAGAPRMEDNEYPKATQRQLVQALQHLNQATGILTDVYRTSQD